MGTATGYLDDFVPDGRFPVEEASSHLLRRRAGVVYEEVIRNYEATGRWSLDFMTLRIAHAYATQCADTVEIGEAQLDEMLFMLDLAWKRECIWVEPPRADTYEDLIRYSSNCDGYSWLQEQRILDYSLFLNEFNETVRQGRVAELTFPELRAGLYVLQRAHHLSGGYPLTGDEEAAWLSVNEALRQIWRRECAVEESKTESYSWRPGVAEKLGYYVYLLIDPGDHQIFYVGKGQSNRCFDHIFEARKTKADAVGDYPKLRHIREIEAADLPVTIELLRHGLDDPQMALAIEAAAIDLIGRTGSKVAATVDPAWAKVILDNRVKGQAKGTGLTSAQEANFSYAATPAEFDPTYRVMLIRVARQFRPGMDAAALYKATRKWWKIGGIRRNGGPRSPLWAMAVFHGVVREVYRIDQWVQPTAKEVAADPSIKGKWAFDGSVDETMTHRYRFSNVINRLPQSAQNPITYINCDPPPRGSGITDSQIVLTSHDVIIRIQSAYGRILLRNDSSSSDCE